LTLQFLAFLENCKKSAQVKEVLPKCVCILKEPYIIAFITQTILTMECAISFTSLATFIKTLIVLD